MGKIETNIHASAAHRAEELFEQHRQDIFKSTDRLFARLMLFQWLAGIGLALWAGADFSNPLHGPFQAFLNVAWLPAVLLAYDRFATTRRVYWIGLGALALALQLLAGHPQETCMTLIILGVFGVVRAPW